jgi:hypothetical protein
MYIEGRAQPTLLVSRDVSIHVNRVGLATAVNCLTFCNAPTVPRSRTSEVQRYQYKNHADLRVTFLSVRTPFCSPWF